MVWVTPAKGAPACTWVKSRKKLPSCAERNHGLGLLIHERPSTTTVQFVIVVDPTARFMVPWATLATKAPSSKLPFRIGAALADVATSDAQKTTVSNRTMSLLLVRARSRRRRRTGMGE